ncbi:putative protein phosphatase 2C-like protein 44 [Lycium ferocissimum]|uniref:putative protein phosphatase 2C-like protein 44 n=1 Tax=Lycium ferocissimum TaxID=112874 RepID=UPI002815796F|nr:putative protein phosphatase 2C-like protein 44 [Lycium ferocissimum]
MGFKDFQLKIAKKLRLKKFLAKKEGNKKRGSGNGKRLSWLTPITHGYYVAEERPSRGGGARPQTPQNNKLECDKVVVQREQVEEQEWWFYGVFDTRIGGGVTKYLQTHLFDNNLNESQMRRKSKETLKKAHVHAKAKVRETEKLENSWKMGSASAIVINGEKLILLNMGEYKAVVCRDGEAFEINRRQQQTTKPHWSHKLFPVVRRIASDSGKGAGADKPSKSSELVVGSEKIDRDTEFVILASPGIWEVMKQQEAVNLIRHLEDPQEAAECLAKEALTRMSKNNVSCLIIRFE